MQTMTMAQGQEVLRDNESALGLTLDEFLGQLMAREFEGYIKGRDKGVEEGLEIAAERVRKMIAERSGSNYDVGRAVLEQLLLRLAARPEDIDPGAAS